MDAHTLAWVYERVHRRCEALRVRFSHLLLTGPYAHESALRNLLGLSRSLLPVRGAGNDSWGDIGPLRSAFILQGWSFSMVSTQTDRLF